MEINETQNSDDGSLLTHAVSARTALGSGAWLAKIVPGHSISNSRATF